jgi:hypothetical protein
LRMESMRLRYGMREDGKSTAHFNHHAVIFRSKP